MPQNVFEAECSVFASPVRCVFASGVTKTSGKDPLKYSVVCTINITMMMIIGSDGQ